MGLRVGLLARREEGSDGLVEGFGGEGAGEGFRWVNRISEHRQI